MMTQVSSARIIPGVWFNSPLGRVLVLLGTLLACNLALSAQSGPALLARGIEKFDDRKYADAIQDLKAARTQLPKLDDYVAYYLASADAELKDFAQVRKDLAPFANQTSPSPLQGRATVLAAKAATETGSAAEAIALLREHYEAIPQPAGDFALAQAYQAANDLAQAAAYYQRVYYLYPLTEFSAQASRASEELRAAMGVAYPPPMPGQMLERGSRLLAAREYAKARTEFSALVQVLGGAEREIASVRVGAADYLQMKTAQAYSYLRALEVTSPEADAERLYYIAECARRLNDDAAMLSAIQKMAREYPTSSWRLKALLSAGNRFLLANQPESYEPVYRACYEYFPTAPEAPYCHWKVTWQAYLRRRSDADPLLREQVVRYPATPSVSAALYFLGRLAEAAKDFHSARVYYDRIGEKYPGYYYGILSSDRLAQPAVARAAPDESALAFLKTIDFPQRTAPASYLPEAATSRRIERFRLLNEAGLSKLADAEIRFGAKTDGQPHVLAMEMARAAEAPHQGLRNMKSLAPDYLTLSHDAAPEKFWELLFPLPFRGDLVRNSTASNLDPDIVAGLIRQESEFNPNVISRKNAYGLTQIVPATGRQLARKAGIKPFQTKMLFQPSTNLRLGTTYLRSLFDQFGGKWEQTLASYNAGMSRVHEWSTWANYQEPAEFVETIPFTETRDYVQSVLRNAAAYRRIYGARLLAAETGPPVKIEKVAAVRTAPAKRPVRKSKRALRRG
jgi:soluble lytic murein transglycosylase